MIVYSAERDERKGHAKERATFAKKIGQTVCTVRQR
jgi:hypothetical protein